MGRPPKFEERSEEIMRAFEQCVARKGLASTTLADVAEEAGLPRSLVRYFMGNRDDMVDRLMERALSRTEDSLARVRNEAGAIPLPALLDLFCGELFANELSNKVVGELWHAAADDAHVRDRLRGAYDYALDLLAHAMQREGVGQSAAQRRSAAFAIVSMLLGEATLRDFGIEAGSPVRAVAGRIVDALREPETQP